MPPTAFKIVFPKIQIVYPKITPSKNQNDVFQNQEIHFPKSDQRKKKTNQYPPTPQTHQNQRTNPKHILRKQNTTLMTPS